MTAVEKPFASSSLATSMRHGQERAEAENDRLRAVLDDLGLADGDELRAWP